MVVKKHLQDLKKFIKEIESNPLEDIDDIGAVETTMDAIASTLLNIGIVKRPKKKSGSGKEYSLENVLKLFVKKELVPAEAPKCVSSFLESVDGLFYEDTLMDDLEYDSEEHQKVIKNLKKLVKSIEKYKGK